MMYWRIFCGNIHSWCDISCYLYLFSTVSGLGFGLMSIAMMTCNMLDIMTGPGMIPARGCSDVNFFTISALIAGAVVMLHAFWGVIAARTWEQVRRSIHIYKWGLSFSIEWFFFFLLALLFLCMDSCYLLSNPFFFPFIKSQFNLVKYNRDPSAKFFSSLQEIGSSFT